MKHTPTEKQKEILRADQDLLVVGPPGSGKTSVALEKVRRFVLNHELQDHQKALFLSFSNAAVNRIRESAQTTFEQDVGKVANITTFHAFCYRFLSSHWRIAGLREPFELLPSEEENILESRFDKEEEFQKEIRRREIENGEVIYDRFAPLTVQVLERVQDLRGAYAGTYPLVIADEYQDTDDHQHQMVSLLAEGGQLICLGDPEQQIYYFREGIPEDRLFKTESDLGLRKIELQGNHRSENSDVLDFARDVRRGKDRVENVESVGYFSYYNDSQLHDCLKQLVVSSRKRVRELKEEGDNSVSIAVMAYSNNFVGKISSIFRSESDDFDHSFSHKVAVPPDQVAIAWDAALTVLEPDLSPRAKTASVLRSAANINRLKGKKSHLKKARKLERWAKQLNENNLSGRAKGAKELLNRIGGVLVGLTGDPFRDIRRVREEFRDLPGNHLKPVVKVLDLRPIVLSSQTLAQDLATTYADTGTYATAREIGKEYLLQERMEVTSEPSSDLVLMTMHKSKGKEFDAVIIVDQLYASGLLTFSERGQDYHPNSRHLLYVAISRARYGAMILSDDHDGCPILPEIV